MYIDRRLWRTGRSLGRTVYAQAGTEAAKGDELLGLMETRELADYVVELHNRDLAAVLRTNSQTTAHFEGGPWHGRALPMKTVTAPVFSARHSVARNYWLDIKSDPPTYRWQPAD